MGDGERCRFWFIRFVWVLFLAKLWLMDWLMQDAAKDLVNVEEEEEELTGEEHVGERREEGEDGGAALTDDLQEEGGGGS